MMDWSRPPVPPGTPPEERPPVLAGFGARLGAFLIDNFLLLGVFYLIALVTGVDLFAYSDNLPGRGETLPGSAVTLELAVSVAGFVYFAILDGTRQTVGKWLVRIRVVRLDGGGPIGLGRGFLRCFGRILSHLPCYLGYFWMLWDEEKQTWHDKIARSIVVSAR